MVKQLSVRLHGAEQLWEIASLLAAEHVNVLAEHVAQTAALRFVQMVCVPHHVAHRVLLAKYGNDVWETDLIAVRVPNTSGQWYRILDALMARHIGIANSYSTIAADGSAIILVETEYAFDFASARRALVEAGLAAADDFAEQLHD